MRPNCVLFDFDGVIADTEASNADFLARALAVYGVTLTNQDRIRLAGRNGRDILQELLERAPYPVTLEELLVVRGQLGNTYVDSPDLKAMPGLYGFLHFLRERGYRLGLVTSTSSHLILAALNRLGLTARFDAIVCGDMVHAHKPDPECYLKAMKFLSALPGECVIIEDSPVGIRAGLSTGATVIGYTGASVKQDTGKAHFTADSFSACAKLPLFHP